MSAPRFSSDGRRWRRSKATKSRRAWRTVISHAQDTNLSKWRRRRIGTVPIISGSPWPATTAHTVISIIAPKQIRANFGRLHIAMRLSRRASLWSASPARPLRATPTHENNCCGKFVANSVRRPISQQRCVSDLCNEFDIRSFAEEDLYSFREEKTDYKQSPKINTHGYLPWWHI